MRHQAEVRQRVVGDLYAQHVCSKVVELEHVLHARRLEQKHALLLHGWCEAHRQLLPAVEVHIDALHLGLADELLHHAAVRLLLELAHKLLAPTPLARKAGSDAVDQHVQHGVHGLSGRHDE